MVTMETKEISICYIILERVIELLKDFYITHKEKIKESHGLQHAMKVYDHAVKAISCLSSPSLSPTTSMEIKIASLLHDVDDPKYFPKENGKKKRDADVKEKQSLAYANASKILISSGIPENDDSFDRIITMIDLVSCSANGNSVPDYIIQEDDGKYHYLLIPRWADRLEAVGTMGVVRCYQYNQERGLPLCSSESPRAKTVEEVWTYATPDRFINYQRRGGTSTDMISHYYDKLLHIACPPSKLVQNKYLESIMANDSVKELVEICLRFGKTGVVDEQYIKQLSKSII